MTTHKKNEQRLTQLSEVQELEAHVGPIWAAAFSPDGRHLAVGGEDTIVTVWRVGEWEELRAEAEKAEQLAQEHGLAPKTPGKMVRIHRQLQQQSDAIKQARAAEQNARRKWEGQSKAGVIKPSTDDEPSYIRLLRGSKKDAE